MNCPHCGAKIDDQAKICIECGRRIDTKNIKIDNIKKESTFLPGLVSFIFPLLGFILFFVFRDTKKATAKACLRASLFGTLTYIILGVLFFFFWIFILINVFA